MDLVDRVREDLTNAAEAGVHHTMTPVEEIVQSLQDYGDYPDVTTEELKQAVIHVCFTWPQRGA